MILAVINAMFVIALSPEFLDFFTHLQKLRS